MSSLDSSSLSFWEVVAQVGFWMVIAGVFGEGVESVPKMVRWWIEKNLPPRLLSKWWDFISTKLAPIHRWMIPIEFISWFICVLGLALELRGDSEAGSIKTKEAVRLSREAKHSSDMAANALGRVATAETALAISRTAIAELTLRAAEANERSKQQESTNLVLRSHVAELELRLKPRRVTSEQITNFIFLTEYVKKIPIEIAIGQEGRDTEDFATDLRTMFNRAGFFTNGAAGFWGITRYPQRQLHRNFGNTNAMPDLFFFTYSTNETNWLPPYQIQLIKGIVRPFIPVEDDERQIYHAIADCMVAIGFSIEWNGFPDNGPGCSIQIPVH